MSRIATIIATMSLTFGLLLGAAAAPAQTVYETRGPNGPVFSDKPQPGARAIALPPLNVIDSSQLTGSSAAGKSEKSSAQRKAVSEKSSDDPETAPPYRSFAIVFPENDGSILANTAVFEVRLALDPALRPGEGHAFVVSINGRAVGQRFTATEFTIPPEFWGDQLPPPNQRLQLGAAIVDRNGTVLKEAAPVQFQLRYATVPRPPRPPKPQAKTAVKPLPEARTGIEPQQKPMSR